MYKDVPIRFCFTHDRVRQAIYSLITDNERAQIHLSIGYIYLEVFQEEERTDLLYDLVNHLNIGRPLIHNINKRIELSDLNILAGNTAKKSTAFAAAENYFAIAQSLLPEEQWAKTPEKYFKLLLEHANVALLSGNLTLSDSLCNQLSDIAQSNIDKAAISIIRVQILEYQSKHQEAIDEVRRSLRLFDIHLPENDQEVVQKIHEEIFKLKNYLDRITIDGLKKLPEMKDPEKIIIMQMVFQMVPAAYQSNPQLFVLISLMMFELTCDHGVSPLSCKCFTDCAIILGSALGDYETSYRLAKAAFSLLNRLEAEAFRAAVCYGFTFTSYMRAHYSESLSYYDMSFYKGLETGDIHHAAFALADKLLLLLYTGKNLSECIKETENAITYLNKINISMPQLLPK
jgi:histidine kinase